MKQPKKFPIRENLHENHICKENRRSNGNLTEIINVNAKNVMPFLGEENDRTSDLSISAVSTGRSDK